MEHEALLVRPEGGRAQEAMALAERFVARFGGEHVHETRERVAQALALKRTGSKTPRISPPRSM